MPTYQLRFTLESAATFGRGDGVAGLVDREVEHDADGFPLLRGRTLKGLLAEECANILFALEQQGKDGPWRKVGHQLFGNPGSLQGDLGKMRIGAARPPTRLREAVHARIVHDQAGPAAHPLTPTDVLESLTTIRRQSAMTEGGAPAEKSLRSTRVILRGVSFKADLSFVDEPDEQQLALLAACISAFRRAGTARNRGRGKLAAELLDPKNQSVTQRYLGVFEKGVSG